MSDFDTDWVKHIDWNKKETYEDLGKLFAALSQAYLGADVSSRTNDLVDGHTKQYAVSRMIELSFLMKNHEKWVHFRPEKNYSAHAGHRKE